MALTLAARAEISPDEPTPVTIAGRAEDRRLRITLVFILTLVLPSVLLSAFAFQAVEAERRARLADRALRLQEKAEELARELDEDVREHVLRLRAELSDFEATASLDAVAPVVSRLVTREPFFARFFLLDAQGRQAYPAVFRPPTLRRWPRLAAESLGGPSGAVLWRAPERLLAALAGASDEPALRLLGRLSQQGEIEIRAAALWDLGVHLQDRGDRPGIFGALEAFRELATMPIGLVDAHGRCSPAEGRLRLALVHRYLRGEDHSAYLAGLRRLLDDLESHAYELPANTVEELAASAGAHLELVGQGEEAAQRVRTLVSRRRRAEEQFHQVDTEHGAELRTLLRQRQRSGPILFRSGDGGSLSYALLPAGRDGPLGLVGVFFDRQAVERDFQARLSLIPGTSLVPAAGGPETAAEQDAFLVPLRAPLEGLALRVTAPIDEPSVVEDTLNLPRDTVYLWAITLSIVGIATGVFVTTNTVQREAKAAQLKSDWVANVTHELKTPLTSIQMFLETLQLGRVSGEEEAKECLDVMARESERLSRLIEQLLVFSRLDTRKPRLKLAFVSPSDLVGEAVGLLADQLNQPPEALGIEVVSVQDLPSISVDRFAMVQAILNLLQNAWKYAAGEDRRVRVVITSRRRHIEIAVEDNGIGVPRRDRRRIFVKFERGTNAERGQIQGSGIGLTLANQIVKAHWGKITYAPLKPNGSRFSVLLPK